MTLDLDVHRKRLGLMLAVEGVCVIVALSALFVDFRSDAAWASPVFIAALVVGIAAQIWFMLGFRKRP